ncbi:MAG: ATP-binding protein [Deltaproteobacteria bacterium]|nr:ATP-binding protein [Deltaproteobacteria bacterium]
MGENIGDAENRTPGFQTWLTSSLEAVDEIELLAADFLRQEHVQVNVFDFRLIIREALLNAVMHGNHLRADKHVDFRIKIDPEAVYIRIIDEGRGFDWNSALNGDPDSMGQSGRGLVIMKEYAQQIIYNQKGNDITLKINRGRRS